jgi:thiosulfate/3-mercaptopyruvate sulfurtransferase
MVRTLVTPAELAAMPDALVIDTRAPDAFASGHIPGAVNLHEIFTYLATSDADGLAKLRDTFAAAFGAAGLSGKQTAVLCEQSMNTGFGQSCRGYYLLSWLGYPKAAVLHGGLAAWQAAGLPISTDAATPKPAEFPLAAEPAPIMLSKEDVRAALGTPGIALLDVRDVDEWIGDSSSPYGRDFCPRKGRLPGARWIEWYRFMKPTGAGPMFKTPAEIRAELATVGITVDTPVYLYCFKGARASNSFVALKEAGVKDVRIYFGSWNEWSRDPSCPIEEGPPQAPPLARAA